MKPTCIIDGCDRTDHKARGLCETHYGRAFANGWHSNFPEVGHAMPIHPDPAPASWILTTDDVENFRYFGEWRRKQNEYAITLDRIREAHDRQKYPHMFNDQIVAD